MAELHRWYNRAIWRGESGLRLTVLRRDPICVLCNTVWSTIADHCVPFRSGKTEKEQWDLFTTLSNLRGVCKACHDAEGEKSFATGNGQRQGRQRSHTPGIVVKTAEGIPFVASSLTQATLDRAIGSPEEIETLLGNL
jgi:hypothetical protein